MSAFGHKRTLANLFHLSNYAIYRSMLKYVRHLQIRNYLWVLLLSLSALLSGCSLEKPNTNPNSSFIQIVEWEPLTTLNEKELQNKMIKLSVEYGVTLKAEMHRLGVPIIAGYINEDFLSQMEELPLSTKTVAIYSTGGISEIALDVADLIQSRGLNVIIIGSCNSACSEYIIPAAKDVTFHDEPLIGFHGNMYSMKFFIEKNDLKNPCSPNDSQKEILASINTEIERIEKLYTKTGHNLDFWKAQVQRLGSAKLIKTSMGTDECIYIQQFPNELWYPTSSQLKTMLGLQFSGGVCADNNTCYEKKIPMMQGVGKKYIVGNEVYDSELR